MNRKLAVAASAAVIAAVQVFAAANLRLGEPFVDNAVLQRGKNVPVWGTAEPGAEVRVAFAGQEKSAKAGQDGAWRVDLDPMEACCEGRTLTATAAGGETAKAANVLVGEVWFAAGQSNMQMPLWNSHCQFRDTDQGALMAAITRMPLVRFAYVPFKWSVNPDPSGGPDGKDRRSRWLPLEPESFLGPSTYQLSAVSFYFARELHIALGVPVGIVVTAVGGTPIDSWTPRSGYDGCDDSIRKYADYPLREDWDKERDAFGVIQRPHHQPTTLWNGMVHKWTPMAMRGMIWYQGCNNSPEPDTYCAKMHALYRGWAKEFKFPGMSFYFAQLAPFTTSWMEMCAAQAKFADEEPCAAMAVTADIGDFGNIHPLRKELVARRLLIHALKRDYGFKIEEDDSPSFVSAETKGDELHVTFRHAKSLHCRGAANKLKPPLFEICGEDGNWKEATITNLDNGKTNPLKDVDGCVLVMKAEGVSSPKKVRYMFHPRTRGTFYNEMSLPLGPFSN